jgi:hypothetical protein
MKIKVLHPQIQPAENLISLTIEDNLNEKKQRSHEFLILSCYVDFNLIEKYAAHLSKKIKLTSIRLAFNFSELYKIGPVETNKKLLTIKTNLSKSGISFEWHALASSRLVHSKGYAVIQQTNNIFTGGLVLITSANFTTPGFTKNGNLELGYLSCDKEDIRDFSEAYDSLVDEFGRDINTSIFKQEQYILKYAILSSGFFIHKWSGNLKQAIGIRYDLTTLAKNKGTIAPELQAVGFEAGDTFTRQVINLTKLPRKEVPSSFMMRFTVETFWGRWCPRDAWDTLQKSFNGLPKFIHEFENATRPEILEKIKHDALIVQNVLISKGLIKKVSPDHLDKWESKIQELRENHKRLERFFIGYEAHELPYTIEQKSDVERLFNNLEEAINFSKSTNIAKIKIKMAIQEADPCHILLENEEAQIIINMHS